MALPIHFIERVKCDELSLSELGALPELEAFEQPSSSK
jgi:hypothetical protein